LVLKEQKTCIFKQTDNSNILVNQFTGFQNSKSDTSNKIKEER